MLCSRSCKYWNICTDKDGKILTIQYGLVIRDECIDFKLPEDYDWEEEYLSGRW